MSKIIEYHELNKENGYKGFSFFFSNGVEASIEFGNGEQCCKCQTCLDKSYTVAKNAEIAAFKDGSFITHKIIPDMVQFDECCCGYVKPEDIVDFLQKCRDYKGD